jgi:hypothetical protein
MTQLHGTSWFILNRQPLRNLASSSRAFILPEWPSTSTLGKRNIRKRLALHFAAEISR